MGLFDLHCAYSGLALNGDTRLILLLRDGQRWVPLCAPIAGFYDRAGGLDEPSDHPKAQVFSQFLGQLGHREFSAGLEAMRDFQLEWKGETLSYALVDAGVYDALPSASPELDSRLPEELGPAAKSAVDGVVPVDVEDGDQYTGLRGTYGCAPRVEAARKRFADSREMLAAIESNAQRWGELDSFVE
ncbi:MAG: hypothetical protein AAFQ82_16205 [Myxococcota bacterium]